MSFATRTIGLTRVKADFVFSANAADPQINISTASAQSANSYTGSYVAGSTDVTITINSGVYLYSTNTSNAGLRLTGGASGDTLTIINNGFIMGMGGAGGNPSVPTAPTAGGNAINLGFTPGAFTTAINNTSGHIGGGGGGGGYAFNASLTSMGGGGGAGGGAGGSATGGAGGAGGGVGASGSNGAVVSAGVATGGGGGRLIPGTTTAGATRSTAGATAGTGGQAGGSGAVSWGNFLHGMAGGGGGYGQAGGTGYLSTGGNSGTSTAGSGSSTTAGGDGSSSLGVGTPISGAAGGKAVALNGCTVSGVSSNTGTCYGLVS